MKYTHKEHETAKKNVQAASIALSAANYEAVAGNLYFCYIYHVP